MCGIYGYIGTPKDPKKLYKLMKVLAVVSEVRGTDGAGFFSLDDEEVIMEKTNSRAKVFVKESKHMKDAIANRKSVLYVGHNRAASVGDVSNIENAHPILGKKLLIVHNGTCRKAIDMIEKEGLIDKRNGETDSEAIMILLEHKGVKETLPKLENYSLVIFNYIDGTLNFARDTNKPMVIYDLRKTLGVRVFASTTKIATSAFKYCKVKYENSFKTSPYHLYEVDIDSGEFTNKGRYKSISVGDSKTDRIRKIAAKEWKEHQTFNFGRRGYTAPKNNYSLGWSGRLPEGVKN